MKWDPGLMWPRRFKQLTEVILRSASIVGAEHGKPTYLPFYPCGRPPATASASPSTYLAKGEPTSRAQAAGG